MKHPFLFTATLCAAIASVLFLSACATQPNIPAEEQDAAAPAYEMVVPAKDVLSPKNQPTQEKSTIVQDAATAANVDINKVKDPKELFTETPKEPTAEASPTASPTNPPTEIPTNIPMPTEKATATKEKPSPTATERNPRAIPESPGQTMYYVERINIINDLKKMQAINADDPMMVGGYIANWEDGKIKGNFGKIYQFSTWLPWAQGRVIKALGETEGKAKANDPAFMQSMWDACKKMSEEKIGNQRTVGPFDGYYDYYIDPDPKSPDLCKWQLYPHKETPK